MTEMTEERMAELRRSLTSAYQEPEWGDINDMAHELFEYIERLRAENERLTAALRDIAYNTSSSVPPEAWPVDHYRWMMNRAVSLAANALIEPTS